jgi:hypothetical protein
MNDDSLPGEPLIRLPAPYARDKGMVRWSPTSGTIEATILDQIQQILVRYADHLPLGNRSIMYQLLPLWVPRAYPDKNALLKMVTATLTKARRGGFIPFEHIDDQRTSFDVPLVAASLPGTLQHMQVDRQAGQAFRVEVWVETKGNVARLGNLCRPYGIGVYSGSGSVPISALRQAARRVIHTAQPSLLLVLGDFDPATLPSTGPEVGVLVDQWRRLGQLRSPLSRRDTPLEKLDACSRHSLAELAQPDPRPRHGK